MFQYENQVMMRGRLATVPMFDHEVMGREFYSTTLLVKRLSGVVDELPVIFPQPMVEGVKLMAGDRVEVTGSIRTHSKEVDGRSRLIISIFAQSVELASEDDTTNIVQLAGAICKAPIFRKTPFGRQICDVMLAVNRSYGKSDYIPCVAWGVHAQKVAQLSTGDYLILKGRLQSREYQKMLADGTYETRTAVEFSIFDLEIVEKDKTNESA